MKLQGLTWGQRMGKAVLVLMGAPQGLQSEVGKGKRKTKKKKGTTDSTGPRKAR